MYFLASWGLLPPLPIPYYAYASRRLIRWSPLLIRCSGRPAASVGRSSLRVGPHRLQSTVTPGCGPSTTSLGQTPARRPTKPRTAYKHVPHRDKDSPHLDKYVPNHVQHRVKDNPHCNKYVPHRDKPPHLVARRNARERRRVQAVNSAFLRLRRHLPHPVVGKHKRLSKVQYNHSCFS